MTMGCSLPAGLALLAIAIVPAAARQASNASWDGTWTGVVNTSEPVSVTISQGKVVSYAIRGGQPFDIGYSQVDRRSVAFGDHANFDVKITRVDNMTASGFAHSPLGDGSATLTKR
jgi:hypothetical protein